MPYDPTRHHRRSIRLKGYDYSQAGAYFITICTQDRACLFGKVVNGEMQLNDAGRMVLAEWNMLPERFPHVVLDAFVVMPNHVHGIVVITNPAPNDTATKAPTIVGAGLVSAPNDGPMGAAPNDGPMSAPNDGATTRTTTRTTTRVAPTVGDIVGAFKSRVTVEYIRGVKTSGWPPFRGRLWQRNYYEHIIRNERALNAIRQYIIENPRRWQMDRENEARTAPDPLAQAIWNMLKQEEAEHSPGGER
jgi:putative transposase